MANFHTWSEDKLKAYIRFVGKDPKRKEHDELVLKAVKIYSSDQQSLPRFEAHYSQSHGGPGQGQPPPAGGFPPPMAGGGNPYPSVAYPGAAPAAGQYPTPGANPYAGPQPGASQYPTVDFTSAAPPGGAGGAAPAANPYPTFPVAGTGMPPGGGPPAASNPYPAPGGAFPAPAAAANLYPTPAQPSAPAAAHNPYPVPGAAAPGGAFPAPVTNPYPSLSVSSAPSAPIVSSAPSNPYPLPGASAPVAPQASSNPYPAPGVGAPAPGGNPYPAMTPGGGSNPYPVPGAGAPAAHGHSSSFPAPTPSGAQSPGRTHFQQQHHQAPQHQHQHGNAQQHHQQQQHGHPQQPQQHHATGRKKALLVGCNYPGTRAELRGCCTDVQHIEYLLKTRFGFQDIRVLRDDLHRQDVMPTKRNILENIDWLVRGAQAGDSLFFHFSGHGSQKRDYSGDESDGMNETLVPTDHERAGQLVDDELNKRLVNPLGPGVRLHALLDACHSGTGLDLPYVTKMEKGGAGRLYWVHEGPTRTYKGTRGGLAVQFGACKDSQLAQDTSALSGGTHTGAATFLFIQSVEQLIAQQQPLTYGRIISEMLHQIKEFQKKQGGGRGLEGGQSTRSGMGGMLASMLIQGAMGSLAGGGGGGGAIGGLMSALLGGGGMQGQTPQLSASDAFDLNMPMHL